MHEPSNEEKLAEKHYITLILRLLVSKNAKHVSGEVVDVRANTQYTISGWRELVHLLRELLARSSFEES